jgi:hypothetical protein
LYHREKENHKSLLKTINEKGAINEKRAIAITMPQRVITINGRIKIKHQANKKPIKKSRIIKLMILGLLSILLKFWWLQF